MAPLVIPPELKKITQFIRRAEEIDSVKGVPQSRIVAYYCRQYAVQTGISLAGSSASAKKCLGEILGQLELEKKAMSAFSQAECRLICRAFADKVFERANMQDRAGVADKDTAKTFYAAASFYEILQQFPRETSENEDDEQQEEDEKRKFSKWKATDILKALKEGVRPTPGGYGENAMEDDDESEGAARDFPSPEVSAPPAIYDKEETTEDEGTEVGLVGSAPPAPFFSLGPLGRSKGEEDNYDSDDDICVSSANKKEEHTSSVVVERPPVVMAYQPPPPPARPPHSTPPATRSVTKETKGSSIFGFGKKNLGGSFKISKEALADATELTKFALKALENKEPDLAAERLQQALKELGR